MSKGTVKSVLASGTFKDLYKWEIEIQYEDGSTLTHNKYTKADNSFVTVGDVITFDVNDKGSLQNVEKVSGSQGQQQANNQQSSGGHSSNTTDNDKPYEPAINQQKQTSITRLSTLKVASEYLQYYFPENKIKPEDICKCADMFVYWVETGKYPEPPQELPEDHPEKGIIDDLPF